MSKHLEHENLIARWMDGRLSEEEKKQLEESGELDALKSVIDDIDTWKVPPFNVEAGLAEIQKRKTGTVPLTKTRNTSWMRIAASIAILLSCGLVWYFVNNGATTVTTEIAETKTIELPQGSLVELDAASSIVYTAKDWENTRSLSLNGQAFFDVTSGATFEVNTPTAKVTVLGTQFNIKAEKERFSVVCYEGKIEVTFMDESKVITMGQSLVLENGRLLKTIHEYTAPEWLTGSNTYNKTPLLEVISDLQRYHDMTVTLPEKYKTLLFTGTIEHNNLKRTLNTIFTTMEIPYTLEEGNKVIFE